jgi:hypothetical protein
LLRGLERRVSGLDRIQDGSSVPMDAVPDSQAIWSMFQKKTPLEGPAKC